MTIRILTAAVLFSFAAAAANILYVDPTFTTNGNGTLANPFKTITSAYNAACASNRNVLVQLAVAQYPDSGTLVFGNQKVLIKGYGPDQTQLTNNFVVSITGSCACALADLSFAFYDPNNANIAIATSAYAYLSNVRVRNCSLTNAVGWWREYRPPFEDVIHTRGLDFAQFDYDAVPKTNLNLAVSSLQMNIAAVSNIAAAGATVAYVDALSTNLNGSAIVMGTVPDARIADSIARDTEVNAATNGLMADATGRFATRGYVDTATNALQNNIAAISNIAIACATVAYADAATNSATTNVLGRCVNKSGDNMNAILGMGGNRITNVGAPTALSDAATRAYVDQATNFLASRAYVDLASANASVYDAYLGKTAPDLYAALTNGAKTVFVPAGTFTSTFAATYTVSDKLVVRGQGRGVSKLILNRTGDTFFNIPATCGAVIFENLDIVFTNAATSGEWIIFYNNDAPTVAPYYGLRNCNVTATGNGSALNCSLFRLDAGGMHIVEVSDCDVTMLAGAGGYALMAGYNSQRTTRVIFRDDQFNMQVGIGSANQAAVLLDMEGKPLIADVVMEKVLCLFSGSVNSNSYAVCVGKNGSPTSVRRLVVDNDWFVTSNNCVCVSADVDMMRVNGTRLYGTRGIYLRDSGLGQTLSNVIVSASSFDCATGIDFGGRRLTNIDTMVVTGCKFRGMPTNAADNVRMLWANNEVNGVLPGAPNDMAGNPLHNVGTPTASSDAANKAYVDGITNGLGSGTVTSVGASGPLASTGGTTPVISLAGQVTGDNIANGSISANHLQDGSVTSNKIASMNAAAGQLLKWTGTAWSPADAAQGGSADLTTVSNQFVLKSGDTMAGYLTLTNVYPTADAHAASKLYVDACAAQRVSRAGDSMTGPLNVPMLYVTGTNNWCVGTQTNPVDIVMMSPSGQIRGKTDLNLCADSGEILFNSPVKFNAGIDGAFMAGKTNGVVTSGSGCTVSVPSCTESSTVLITPASSTVPWPYWVECTNGSFTVKSTGNSAWSFNYLVR